MNPPRCLMLLLVLGSPGCARSAASASASSEPWVYGEGRGGDSIAREESMDAGYGEAETTASGPAAAPVVQSEAASEMADAKKNGGSHDRMTTELAAPTKPASGNAQGSSAGAAEPALEVPETPAETRYLVYTAQMVVSVFDLDRARTEAEHIPDHFGGYLSQLGNDVLVLRLPSAQLRPAMDALGKLGIIESRSLTAQEVTAEFVDLESRIRALQETQTQLLALLSKARSVEEALQVRSALDRINTELEVLQGRLRQLSNQIAYSTLHLHLIERGPHDTLPTSNDPFPWVDRLGVEATEWK